MDEEYTGTMGYESTNKLKTKRKINLIGSITNGTINYPKDQKFFHSTDIPEKAQIAAKEMKDKVDRDLFKLKRPEWNASVSKAGLPADDNDENNLFAIRKGLRDFHPLEPKDPIYYPGTDTREKYTDWNVSNQVPIPLHQQKRIAEETIMRMTKTKEMNEKILTNYKNPYERAKDHSKMLETKREFEKDMKSTFKSQLDEQLKETTDSKKYAIVMKKVYEHQHKKDDMDPEATFKPDLTKTLVSRRKRVYHHTGKWEKSKFEDKESWSCCMSFDKNSEGCNVKIMDLDKYNIVSY